MNQTLPGNVPKRSSIFEYIQKRRSLIIEIISALLILLFMYASVSKLVTFQSFYGEMNNQPLPNWMTPYLVWGIPVFEILISAGLIFDKTKLLSLYGSFTLMTLFTIYIGLVLVNVFPYTPCSCGGILKQFGWKDHFIFNLFFVIISIVGIILNRRKQNPNI